MNKNKGFIGLGLILAIIAVLIVGGGAYYLGTKNSSAPKNVVENLPVENQSQNIKANDNFLSDLSWKTYTDVDAGYELKYPSDWIIDIGVASTTYPSPIIKKFKDITLTSEKINVDKSGEGWYVIVPKGETEKVGEFQFSVFQYPNFITTIKELINNGMDAPQDLKTDYLNGITNMQIGDTMREVTVTGDNKSARRIEFMVSNKLFIFDFSGMFYKNDHPSFGNDEETYKKYLPVFNTILKDFKIIQSSISSENSPTETFSHQPGAIKSITAKGNNQWMLAVDLLSRNSGWLPGVDGTGGFFINQNPKIRNLNITTNTKTYNCGEGPDGNATSADVLQNTSNFITQIQKNMQRAILENRNGIGEQRDETNWEFWQTAYFDINGINITAIYQQCLP